jgi:hypothetical protein
MRAVTTMAAMLALLCVLALAHCRQEGPPPPGDFAGVWEAGPGAMKAERKSLLDFLRDDAKEFPETTETHPETLRDLGPEETSKVLVLLKDGRGLIITATADGKQNLSAVDWIAEGSAVHISVLFAKPHVAEGRTFKYVSGDTYDLKAGLLVRRPGDSDKTPFAYFRSPVHPVIK